MAGVQAEEAGHTQPFNNHRSWRASSSGSLSDPACSPSPPAHQRRCGGLVVLLLRRVLIKHAGEGVRLAAVAALVGLGALGRGDGDAVLAGSVDAVLGVPAGRACSHARPDAHKHLQGRGRGRGGGGEGSGSSAGMHCRPPCMLLRAAVNAGVHAVNAGLQCKHQALQGQPSRRRGSPCYATPPSSAHLQLLQLQLVVQPGTSKRVGARQACLPRVLLGLGALGVARKQLRQAPACSGGGSGDDSDALVGAWPAMLRPCSLASVPQHPTAAQ